MEQELDLVTGAYGYTGQYIASKLLEKSIMVRTLTGSLSRDNAFGGKVEALPYNFYDTEKLRESFKGVSIFYNTYWARFKYGGTDHRLAYENTVKLFDAAKSAGVKKIVHVSAANCSADSGLSYYKYKALAEAYLKDLGIPFSILKPAALFGGSGILINNMAWMIKHLPVFGIFGSGDYGFSPVFVEDLAKLAVEQGESKDSSLIEAAGPESFIYKDLIAAMCGILGKKPLIVKVPPFLGFIAGAAMGTLMRDVTLTRDEIHAITSGMLEIKSAPVCGTKFTDWLKANRDIVGERYFSETARRKDRKRGYERI